MILVDTHCHLNDEKIYPDRSLFVTKAMEAGLRFILCVGWDLESSKKAIQIAHEFPIVYAAVGIHPENLEGVSEEAIQEIKELSKDEKVLAIGEIGLDYHWFKKAEERELQKKWFIRQIDLANEVKLPISIHAREAAEDTLSVLKEHRPINGAVLHCYSGSTETLKELSKLGFYFGFDGPITYKNSIVPKSNVVACPFDRLLSETDSPYLSPEPYRGASNAPEHIKEIVNQMAILRRIPFEEIASQIAENTKNIFHVELKNG